MSDVTFDPGDDRHRQVPERPDRKMSEPPTPDVEIREDPTPSPDDVLAETKRNLEARERELAAERARAAQAEQMARQAAAQAEAAHRDRSQDQSDRVASTLEAAKADHARARQAWLLAREAGNTEAEAAALDDMSSANWRRNQAEADLAQRRSMSERRKPAEQPAQPAISNAAQDWIARNPRFNTDAAFRDRMLAEHEAVKARGVLPDSPAYFDALDAAVARHDQQGRPPASSSGGPSGRGTSSAEGTGSRSTTVDTPAGRVGVTQLGGGRLQFSLAPAVREAMEEGARITGMPFARYVNEQVMIARERLAGGDGGWVVGDGKEHR